MLELYQRIKKRREELNMSQEELAQKLGYKSRSSINKIEKGQNDIPQSKIIEFANALDTTPEFLMGWQKNSSNNYDNSLPVLNKKDERHIQKKLKSILNDLDPKTGIACFDDDEPLTEEDKEILRVSVESTLRLTKQLAKQKFTPKKYRKE